MFSHRIVSARHPLTEAPGEFVVVRCRWPDRCYLLMVVGVRGLRPEQAVCFSCWLAEEVTRVCPPFHPFIRRGFLAQFPHSLRLEVLPCGHLHSLSEMDRCLEVEGVPSFLLPLEDEEDD